ncbi:CRISPR-associated DxTHG motif protein [Vibrio owensii]|nr:CRISPR-associated DxTHG motif protein [Vibrio owensii]
MSCIRRWIFLDFTHKINSIPYFFMFL